MIVYTANKARFRQDVMTNDIGAIIFDTFKAVTGHGTKRSEIDSWTNSLQYMERVLSDPAILVELKQWQQADLTTKDGIVVTTFKGGPQETPHPSYQAWTYKRLLEDYIPNPAVPGRIPRSSGFRTKRYARSVRKGVCRPERVPAMRGKSFSRNFSANATVPGTNSRTGRLASVLKGKEEFVMVDDQKIVYETALAQARQAKAELRPQGPFPQIITSMRSSLNVG